MSPRPSYLERLGVAPLSVDALAAAPRTKLYELMVAALLERGRPMTLEDVCARLVQAGVRPRSGDMALSLTRSWRGREPVYRGADGRFGLDLSSPELARCLGRLRRRCAPATGARVDPPVASPAPAARAAPAARGPLSWSELELALRDRPIAQLSGLRQAAAYLDAVGERRKPLADVEDALASLTPYRRPLERRAARSWGRRWLRLDGEHLVYDPTISAEVEPMRAAIRALAAAAHQEREAREQRARRQAVAQASYRELKRREQEAAARLERCLLHPVPSPRHPRALAIVDLKSGLIGALAPGELARAPELIGGYDLVVAPAARELVEALGLDADGMRLLDLKASQKTIKVSDRGRPLRITLALLAASLSGERSPLSDARLAAAALDRPGSRARALRRLQQEADLLARLWLFGMLHGRASIETRGRRLSVPVSWSLPGDRSLYGILDDAREQGVPVEVILQPPQSYRRRWEIGVPARVLRIDAWYAQLDLGHGADVFERDEIYAARPIPGGARGAAEQADDRAASTLSPLREAAARAGVGQQTAIDLAALRPRARAFVWAEPALLAAAEAGGVATLDQLLHSEEAQRWLAHEASRSVRDDLCAFVREEIERLEAANDAKIGDGQGPTVPKGRRALLAWARKSGVSEAAAAPVSSLVGRLAAGDRRWAERTGLAEAQIHQLWTKRAALPLRLFDPGAVARIQRAAWLELRERAADAQRALAEEARQQAQLASRPLPDDRVLSPLIASLREARAAVREAALPRPADRIGARALVFEELLPRFIYREASAAEREASAAEREASAAEREASAAEREVSAVDREASAAEREAPAAADATGPGDGVVVEIGLGSWRSSPIVARCSCAAGSPARCSHALAALDRALEALTGDGAEPLRRRVRQALAASWARAIECIDRRLAWPRARQQRRRRALGWELSPGPRGSIALLPVLCRRTGSGRFERARALSFVELCETPELWTLEADQRAVQQLQAPSLDGRDDHLEPGSATPGRAHRALFELAGHPRVQLAGSDGGAIEVERLALSLALEPLETGGARLRPALAGRPLSWGAFGALDRARFDGVAARIDGAGARCTVARWPEPLAGLLRELEPTGAIFPAEALEELEPRLCAIASEIGAVDVARAPIERQGVRTPLVLQLEPRPGGGLSVRALVRPLGRGPGFAPGAGPDRVVGRTAGGWRSVARDRSGERALARELLGCLPMPPAVAEGRPHIWLVEQQPRALELVEALERLSRRLLAGEAGALRAEDLLIEWPEKQAWWISRRASPGDLRLRIDGARDWFDIDGSLELEGARIDLQRLLAAARARRRYIAISPRRWLALGPELCEWLSELDDLVRAERGRLRLPRPAAFALGPLLDRAGEPSVCESLSRLLARIAVAELADPSPPAGLQATLRPYQLAGVRWLTRLSAWEAGACLADDMGLGKTVQAVALLIARSERGPALVVAPTSVCFNWIDEIVRFAPTLRPRRHAPRGPDPQLAAAGPRDVLVASYGQIARHAGALAQKRFATLVLDEAQAIKNAATRRAGAVRSLAADWRLALTGTPIENHLGELWSLFAALSPGLFGSRGRFRERFAIPIERYGDEQRSAALTRLVRPFVLRRTKRDVAADLPPRAELTTLVELSSAERALYDRARLEALATIDQAAARERPAAVLAGLTRLRQLACHPRLADDASTVASAKLETLVAIAEQLVEAGHRALIFSQFVRHLQLIGDALSTAGLSYLMLDGSTPGGERGRRVRSFEAGEAPLFLISLRAGGTGLNLTRADHVIHLDPWWNPAVEDQASDRAHRIGQRAPVTIQRLVSRHTIEQAVMALHGDKRRLVSSIFEGADRSAALSTDELIALICSSAVDAA